MLSLWILYVFPFFDFKLFSVFSSKKNFQIIFLSSRIYSAVQGLGSIQSSRQKGAPKSCTKQEIFFFFSRQIMWHTDLSSWLGIELCPLQWKCRFLTTGPPGKSQQEIFIDNNKWEKGNYAGHLLLGSRGLLSFIWSKGWEWSRVK